MYESPLKRVTSEEIMSRKVKGVAVQGYKGKICLTAYQSAFAVEPPLRPAAESKQRQMSI